MFWLALTAALFSTLAGATSLDDIARSPEWRKLLHSAPNRRAELDANLQEFLSPTSQADAHAQCRFPARFLWLKTQVDLSRAPQVECAKFSAYRRGIDATSASVVFSSYYANNPASAFGHTMLRMGSHGISYAAVMTTSNVFLYAFKGLFGFFEGRFSVVPFFYKIREYNDFESRDLWSYELDLTPFELEMLVAHSWELSQSKFDYYYLSENCSYQIHALIEAAAPRFDLTRPLHFYVIPSDTVRLLVETPGLVKSVEAIPSSRSRFKMQYASLSNGDRATLESLLATKKLPKLASNSLPILDAALDFVSDESLKSELILARAEFPTPSVSGETFLQAPPHSGHKSARLGVEGAYADAKGGYGSLGLRFALHDLLDRSTGYPTGQLEVAHVRGRYYWERQNFELDDLTLFRITSLAPIEHWERKVSWKARVNLGTQRDGSCDHCLAGGFETGAGFSYEPISSIMLYTTMDMEFYLSPKFDRSLARLGFGPAGGARVELSPRWIALFTGQYRFQFPTSAHHNFQYGAALRWSALDDVAIDARYQRFANDWETAAGFYYYF